jgi:hypothetical protein
VSDLAATARRALALRAEATKRSRWREALLSELFDGQLAVHHDKAQFRADHSGRRSGKTERLPRSALVNALEAGFNEVVLIGAETKDKAKSLHWANISAVIDRHKLPFAPNASRGAFTSPWGSVIQFWGMKDRKSMELIRGFKLKSAEFDECATFAHLLKALTQDVLEPALGDTGGTATLSGTPSVTRAGNWFDICNGAPGWSVHRRTVLDNPKFPRDARAWLDSVLAKNEWASDCATYQREYMGRFVNDSDAQVYRYLPERNDIDAMPAHYDRSKWLHVLGLDFGVNDDCAWTVWTAHPHRHEMYIVRSFKQAGLLVDDAAKVTAELCDEFQPVDLPADTGGIGKPYAEQWNRRYAGRLGMPQMRPADKQEKRAHIDLLNTDMRTGRIKLVKDECAELSSEYQSLPWHESRLREHPGYPNHCCDSALYGYMGVRAYANKAPEPRLADRDPDEGAAWLEQQEAEALRAEQSREDWERY